MWSGIRFLLLLSASDSTASSRVVTGHGSTASGSLPAGFTPSRSWEQGEGRRFSIPPSIYGRVIPPMSVVPNNKCQSVRASVLSRWLGQKTSIRPESFLPTSAPRPSSWRFQRCHRHPIAPSRRPSLRSFFHQAHSGTMATKHWYGHSSFHGTLQTLTLHLNTSADRPQSYYAHRIPEKEKQQMGMRDGVGKTKSQVKSANKNIQDQNKC